MNIEIYKHLFVSVEESLPEAQITMVIMHDNKNGDKVLNLGSLQNGGIYHGIHGFELKNVTHWLDLSILTTKERAVKFAEEAISHEKLICDQGYDYINLNQNDL